jgi:GPH family glycoside/pentoside/hexuronide:cation symporter
MAIARIGFTLVSAGLPYFAKYRLHNERLAASLVVVLMGVVVVMVPVWRRIAARRGKAQAYGWSLVVVSLTLASTWWVPQGSMAAAYGAVVLVGIGMAGHWVLPYSILPDVIDWDEADTGERRAGLYLGIFGLFDKLARTLAMVSMGWLLAATGFSANAELSPSAMLAVRALFGPLPAAFVLLAVPLLMRFPIDRAAYETVRQTLEARRAAASPQTSAETSELASDVAPEATT